MRPQLADDLDGATLARLNYEGSNRRAKAPRLPPARVGGPNPYGAPITLEERLFAEEMDEAKFADWSSRHPEVDVEHEQEVRVYFGGGRDRICVRVNGVDYTDELVDEMTGFPTWIDLMRGESSRARDEQDQLAQAREIWGNFIHLLNAKSGEELAAWVSSPWAPRCAFQMLSLTGITEHYFARGQTSADSLRTLSPEAYGRYRQWMDEQRRAAETKEIKRQQRFFGIERRVREGLESFWRR